MAASDTDKTRESAGKLADATRESYRTVVGRAFAARESNSRLAWDFFEKTTEEIQDQARLNHRASHELAENTRKQGEAFGMAAESLTLYEEFLWFQPNHPRK